MNYRLNCLYPVGSHICVGKGLHLAKVNKLLAIIVNKHSMSQMPQTSTHFVQTHCY